MASYFYQLKTCIKCNTPLGFHAENNIPFNANANCCLTCGGLAFEDLVCKIERKHYSGKNRKYIGLEWQDYITVVGNITLDIPISYDTEEYIDYSGY